MYQKLIVVLFCLLILSGCSKEEVSVKPPDINESYKIYEEGLNAMQRNEFFFAAQKFSEAEKILPRIEDAGKALLMSGFCYYSINFYDEAQFSLENYLKKYPAGKDVEYASYLHALTHYEQILDEKKDLGPLLISKKIIKDYIKKYPNNEYSLDLKFKLDLIQNQLAAKEVYVAKYYIKTQKWIPAINRLKNVVKFYDETVYIEEALHRLVEIYYNLGLIDEAQKTAKTLGYNYNSSEWYEKSYALLNKDYSKEKSELEKASKKKETGLIKRTINKILKK
tara:strand:- start:541 stop:1380 length:840 start_codon:yes stop_codon:yes gene_type:complete